MVSALALASLAIGLTPSTVTAQALTDESEVTLATLLRKEAIAYEFGEGVNQDLTLAAKLYCKSARLGDAEAQYNLGWMLANGRGEERNDISAAFFFNAAAEQGLPAAIRMLSRVGGPTDQVPECMREPAPKPKPVTPVQEARPKPPPAEPPVDYAAIAPRNVFDLVMKMAPQYKVEPQLALSIIAAESNFDSLALSPKNARGLMQLIPATSERFNVLNAFDPAQNIRGGLSYLRWLLAYFQGDVALVAAAYNSGEGTVERYRGVPPYMETRAYVRKILASFGTREHPYDDSVTRPSASLTLMRAP